MGFSEELHLLRIEKGLSQKDLAKALGFSQASIGYWEKGQRTPSIDAVRKIAEFFNVPLDTLICEPPKPIVPEGVDLKFTTIRDFKDFRSFISHYQSDEYTEEELEEIRNFAEFIKSRRKAEDALKNADRIDQQQ